MHRFPIFYFARLTFKINTSFKHKPSKAQANSLFLAHLNIYILINDLFSTKWKLCYVLNSHASENFLQKVCFSSVVNWNINTRYANIDCSIWFSVLLTVLHLELWTGFSIVLWSFAPIWYWVWITVSWLTVLHTIRSIANTTKAHSSTHNTINNWHNQGRQFYTQYNSQHNQGWQFYTQYNQQLTQPRLTVLHTIQ